MLDNDTTELDENLDDLAEGDDDTLDGDQGEDSPEGGEDTLAADASELVIELEGDDAAESDEAFDPKAKAALRALRDANKDMRRRLREVEKAQPAPAEQALRPKPTLQDHAYNEDAWEADLLQWASEKAKADVQVEAIRNEFVSKRDAFMAAAKSLPVADYDDVADAVRGVLSVEQQQAMILHMDKDEAARVVYALGKSPTRLEALGKIKDPVRFGIELAKISMGVKVTTQPKTKPEAALKPGGAASPQTRDLSSLKKRADATGDYTEYLAAKRAQAK